jgi:hypothetical protein
MATTRNDGMNVIDLTQLDNLNKKQRKALTQLLGRGKKIHKDVTYNVLIKTKNPLTKKRKTTRVDIQLKHDLVPDTNVKNRYSVLDDDQSTIGQLQIKKGLRKIWWRSEIYFFNSKGWKDSTSS